MTDTLLYVAAAVPPTLPLPSGIPAELAAAIDWPSLGPIPRLVLARLYGRARDRDAVAAAWDEAKARGLTMRDLVRTVPPGTLRDWCWRKLGYANRNE